MTAPLPQPPSATPDKSSHAFRTITEVAADLDVAQHVLRFWETKFTQIKPMKRGGGRRYYRPEDVTLLRRIKDLLYTDGYTIKGVQQLLRKGGETEGEIERREAAARDHKSSELRAVLAELEDLRGVLEGN